MIYPLSSSLFDSEKYILEDQIDQFAATEIKTSKFSLWSGCEKINDSNRVSILFYLDQLQTLNDQKFFFKIIEANLMRKSPLFLSLLGYSLFYENPLNKSVFPAIIFEKLPPIKFSDCQENIQTFTASQKSIIAFGTLVALESIFEKTNIFINFMFDPKNLYLTSEREPKLFLMPFNVENKFNDWAPPEVIEGECSDNEKANVYAYGKFLLQLFSNSEVIINVDELVESNNLMNLIIALCLSKNNDERPDFSQLLKYFIEFDAHFQGTNMDEFRSYRIRLFKALKRKIPIKFYSENVLQSYVLKGDVTARFLYAKFLSKDINRKNEFIPLILSLLTFKATKVNAVKLYTKYFLRNISEMKEYPLKPINLTPSSYLPENIDEFQYFSMYKVLEGDYNYSLSLTFSKDPIASINYCECLLNSNLTPKISNDIKKRAFSLLADAFYNPKLEIYGKDWQRCIKLIQSLVKSQCIINFLITDSQTLYHFNSTFHPMDIESKITNFRYKLIYSVCYDTDNSKQKFINDFKVMGKNENAKIRTKTLENQLASFFVGKYLLDINVAFDIKDDYKYFKQSIEMFKYPSAYAIGIMFYRNSKIEEAIGALKICLEKKDSIYFQYALETLGYICLGFDFQKALIYYQMAPELTDFKKYGLSMITIKSNFQPMSIFEANQFLQTSDFPLCVLYRLCQKIDENKDSMSKLPKSCQIFFDATKYLIGYDNVTQNYYTALSMYMSSASMCNNEKKLYTSVVSTIKNLDFREWKNDIDFKSNLNQIFSRLPELEFE